MSKMSLVLNLTADAEKYSVRVGGWMCCAEIDLFIEYSCKPLQSMEGSRTG